MEKSNEFFISEINSKWKEATLIEYGLLLVLIMVVCATVVALIGTRTSELFIFSL
jgi:Flp pilus assembly pilin Flp